MSRYWKSSVLFYFTNAIITQIPAAINNCVIYFGIGLFNKAKKNMCVSDFIGLQNRVGRSEFFFWNIFVLSLEWDFKQILTYKPQNFSQSGPIYIIFVYMILIKKNWSRAIKNWVGRRKKGEIFCIVLEWDFSSNI